ACLDGTRRPRLRYGEREGRSPSHLIPLPAQGRGQGDGPPSSTTTACLEGVRRPRLRYGKREGRSPSRHDSVPRQRETPPAGKGAGRGALLPAEECAVGDHRREEH